MPACLCVCVSVCLCVFLLAVAGLLLRLLLLPFPLPLLLLKTLNVIWPMASFDAAHFPRAAERHFTHSSLFLFWQPEIEVHSLRSLCSTSELTELSSVSLNWQQEGALRYVE